MYSKLQVSCIRKLWSLVDIVSVDESAEEVRQAVQSNTNTQMLRMDYKMQNLSRFRRRLSRNILELERNGGFTVLNASYPHFSDSECDDAEANYNVMNMLQLIALVISSLESYKPELPTSYLSYTAKVNSRLHDLDVLSYNIFGQALLNTNSEFLAEDRNVSVPSEQEAIFSEFISEMFSVLIEHSIDPQLDIPMVAPQKHIIKLSESAQAKVKARMTSKKKSQEPPNIPIRESMLSLKMPDLRNSDLDLASLQSSQLSIFRSETSSTDSKNSMEDQPSAATSFSMVSPNYHSGELTRTNSVTSNMTISPKEAQKFSIRGLSTA